MNDRVAFNDSEPPEDEEVITDPKDGETPSPEEQAWEDRARRMGWRPEAEWHGDKSKWLPAREFVERGENNTPILIERMHKLERINADQGKQLTEANTKLTETGEVLKQLYGWAQRADQRAYERAVAELEARSRAAVTEADTAGYDRAQSELAALEKGRDQVLPAAPTKPPEPPAPAAPTTDQLDPVIVAWTNEQAWWFQDPMDKEPHDFAISMFGMLAQQRQGTPAKDILEEVLKRVKKAYPEKFMNQRRQAPPAVSEPGAPGTRPRTNKGFSYEDLPKDAKQQCDKFVKTIPGFTKEAYVKEYERQNGDQK